MLCCLRELLCNICEAFVFAWNCRLDLQCFQTSCSMAQCCQLIKEAFPKINEDIYSYVESVLESSGEDFENEDDVYEAIGEVLLDLETNKSEDDVR